MRALVYVTLLNLYKQCNFASISQDMSFVRQKRARKYGGLLLPSDCYSKDDTVYFQCNLTGSHANKCCATKKLTFRSAGTPNPLSLRRRKMEQHPRPIQKNKEKVGVRYRSENSTYGQIMENGGCTTYPEDKRGGCEANAKCSGNGTHGYTCPRQQNILHSNRVSDRCSNNQLNKAVNKGEKSIPSFVVDC